MNEKCVWFSDFNFRSKIHAPPQLKVPSNKKNWSGIGSDSVDGPLPQIWKLQIAVFLVFHGKYSPTQKILLQKCGKRRMTKSKISTYKYKYKFVKIFSGCIVQHFKQSVKYIHTYINEVVADVYGSWPLSLVFRGFIVFDILWSIMFLGGIGSCAAVKYEKHKN